MDKTPQEQTIEWDGRTLRLSYSPEYWSDVAHLEIHSEDGEPLPITETGYRSHFFLTNSPPDMEEIITFVIEWLNEEAKTKQWCTYIAQSQQMELFC